MKLFPTPGKTSNYRTFLWLCFLLLVVAPATAQLQADFITDKTSGCSPLKISFTNKTTGAPASAAYRWDFGNGNISTVENPSAVFIEEKTFYVTLTVSDGNKTSVKTKTITVAEKPILDFIASANSGCLPLPINFTALPGAMGLSYTWDFGDGTVLQNTNSTSSHTYTFEQTATVSLSASNSAGCSNTITKNNLLKVLPAIQADFTAEKTIYCAITDEVKFNNAGSGPGVLTYLWDFGDGNVSAEKEPLHVYNKKGVFPVKLTVTSSEGCLKTMEKPYYLNIANFKTDFSQPLLICQNNNATFNNTSTPSPDRSNWVINATNAIITSRNESITEYFSTSGFQTIELTNTFGDCQETISKQIEITPQPSLKGFLVNIEGNCGAPVKVNFTDTSTASVKWLWNFTSLMNGPSSDLKNPAYTYTRDDAYMATLTIYNLAGCSNTTSKQVPVSKPLVGIFTTDLSGHEACDRITKQFTTRSTEQIIEYKWDFGDGNVSVEKEPLHTFSQPGTYNVKLDYTTINGCKGTVPYIYTIRVHYSPLADFSVQDSVCGNSAVQFINKSKNAATYIWDFGNNSTSSESFPLTKYNTEGLYSVKLIAAIGMCADTVIKEKILRVLPPFSGEIYAVNTCDGDRGTVQFVFNSNQAEKWNWDFGDGNTLSYTSPPAEIKHHYIQSGSYNASVEITNGTCLLRSPVKVYVLRKQDPKLVLPDNILCRGNGNPQFEITGLQRPVVPYPFNLGFPYNYEFQYANGSSFPGYAGGDLNAIPFRGSLSGMVNDTQTIRAISKSVYFGCTDTSTIATIILKGPAAGFNIISSNTCNALPVLFQDRSAMKNNIPIVKWDWDWGDGKKDTYTQGGNVSHIYKQPGEYYVTLTVTDKDGCYSSTPYYSNLIRVGGIKAAFSVPENLVPLNTTVNFYNNSVATGNGDVSFEWNLGNGIVFSGYAPSYQFTTAGEYTIKLIARNQLTGCADSVAQKITVRDFNTGFTMSASFIGSSNKCAPVLARFKSTSSGYSRLVWNFGDGVVLENQTNPSHVYTKAGIYPVTLSVYGYNGLFRQYNDTVKVNQPSASITAAVSGACIGQAITLSSPDNGNTLSWTWDFGDGSVISHTDSFATHSYEAEGKYTPTLVITDANGCPASVTLNEKIIINPDPVIQIEPGDAIICRGNTIELKATGAATYSWRQGESTPEIPGAVQIFSPTNTTAFTVNAIDENGCRGSAVTTVKVVQPFTINSNTRLAEICKGGSIQLDIHGADEYKWINTIEGLDNTAASNPVAAPPATTNYTVVGYDKFHCFTDTADILVKVNPSPQVNTGKDIETIVGSEINLSPVTSNDVIRWAWSPADYLSCKNCSSPVSQPRSDIEYVLTVQNQYNCSAKDSVKIKVVCAMGSIYIPEAFSPNRDSRNDFFSIVGKGIKVVKSFRIYNRWGELVFEKRNFFPGDKNSAWDGTTKGHDNPVGIYVYIAEMECNAGETSTKKGTVTLIR